VNNKIIRLIVFFSLIYNPLFSCEGYLSLGTAAGISSGDIPFRTEIFQEAASENLDIVARFSFLNQYHEMEKYYRTNPKNNNDIVRFGNFSVQQSAWEYRFFRLYAGIDAGHSLYAARHSAEMGLSSQGMLLLHKTLYLRVSLRAALPIPVHYSLAETESGLEWTPGTSIVNPVPGNWKLFFSTGISFLQSDTPAQPVTARLGLSWLY